MTITLAEFEEFHKSVELMKQLRVIPLEIIEYYLQNERGYVVKKADSNEEETVIVRPARQPDKGAV